MSETTHDIRPDILGGLLLELYEGCSTVAPEGFRRWALELLRNKLPFDSGLWVRASINQGVPQLHDIYLYNQPEEMMQSYSRYADRDHLAEQVACAPGHTVGLFDLVPREEWVKFDYYEEHCARYGIEQAISTAWIDPLLHLITFVSLYRAEPEPEFTAGERRLKELVMPHLVSAEALNRQIHLRRKKIDSEEGEHYATCGDDGLLSYCEAPFVKLSQRIWPEWVPPELPEELKGLVRNPASGPLCRGGVCFRVVPWEPGHLVFAREQTWRDLLTPREGEVAQLLADGLSYKEIARMLGLSASTITNHANRIYEKLGVRNKTELGSLYLQADP